MNSYEQFQFRRAKKRFVKNRHEFYKDIAEALSDKSDLVTEITNLRKTAAIDKNRGDYHLYTSMLEKLDKGYLFHALDGLLPPTDLMIVNAYESAGQLEKGLRFLENITKLANKMKATIIGAVAMPIFVMLILAGILAMHAFMLTPILESIYKVEYWPVMGKILYPVSQVVKNYGIFLGAGFITAGIAYAVSINNWSGPQRAKLDNNVYAVFRDFNGALLLTSIAAMMQAGAGVMESLRRIEEFSTPWMRWHVRQMIIRLDEFSQKPAKALDTGIIDRKTMNRIVAYGDRSGFLEAMKTIGLESLNKTDEKIAGTAKKLNLIMMVVIGLTFGLVIGGTVSTGLHAETVIKAQIK